jgi:succinate dehydrogenase / fumarate reductase cytochrome b subunit
MSNSAIKRKPRKNRPKNLNLFSIRFPVNAVVSILHRASGMALFAILPVVLLGFQASLASQQSFDALVVSMQAPYAKVIFILLAWAFFHHFFAGFRHLGMDAHMMTDLPQARFTSRIVMALGVIATLIFAYVIW